MEGIYCLNPYYTGIHLHAAQNRKNYEATRLNPYYTGIHLHNRNGNLNEDGTTCLNPYYTGIHLHSF